MPGSILFRNETVQPVSVPSLAAVMESNQSEAKSNERTDTIPVIENVTTSTQTDLKQHQSPEKHVHKCKKANLKAKGGKKSSKSKVKDSSDSSSSSSESDSSDSDSEATKLTDDSSSDSSSDDEDSESDSEAEKKKRRKSKLKKRAKKQDKDKKRRKAKRKARKDISSESSSASETESDETLSELEDEDEEDDAADRRTLRQLEQRLGRGGARRGRGGLRTIGRPAESSRRAIKQLQQLELAALDSRLGLDKKSRRGRKDRKKQRKRASKLEFKRVDQLWDSTIHNYKLSDTTGDEESSEYDQYLFTIRRTFDWEGKFKQTWVDIKSKLLKEALSEIMDGVKGVSLVEDTPALDPNTLFLYLEDLRSLMKTLKSTIKTERMKKKLKKKAESKLKHLKVLIKYLDKDYAEIKKSLYPMLDSGIITFDLLWALYKPNTLAYTSTYDAADEPRAFKIEYSEKQCSFMRGESYSIEGRYLEYDGKSWGMGTMDSEVSSFKGARKITSLSCYPLKFHKDEAKIRLELIGRGKKFVSLQGVNYRSMNGLAFYKKKRQVIKVNVNGRIMVDPAIHRRILPNYQVSTVKPKDPDEIEESDEDSDDECCSCGDDEDENNAGSTFENLEEEKTKLKVIMDEKDRPQVVRVPVDADGNELMVEKLEALKTSEENNVIGEPDKKALPVFTDEEYLIASPVVLGFAFSEKMWLEFTVSGVQDIVWNEGAYESLVLPENTKQIVKALVESHTHHAAESIDDVIQGKGKGLVAVLHGPPGTGKTLTAEGISELLKCPLYMVSAGELGTDPNRLEGELQKILDIAHAWGAVLLLDEADVFLEKRTIQDIHRNALVSIFLRLLEYFQGILFLTTNRVETFDDAFQSRIHIALRYGELTTKAKKSVFKMFIERVRVMEGVDTMPFTEEDLDRLARHDLNGRQIKNTIRTAQALAVNKKEPLSMEHIKRVLDVLLSFDRDLKGGTGYEDAMKHYM